MQRRIVLALFALGTLQAADLELQQETLRDWDAYVHKAIQAMQERVRGKTPFLRVEENADRLAHVREGEIVVWPAAENCPKRVPSGLIHDWIGAAFIPGARIDDLLAVARNYSQYREVYKPGVLDAKLLSHHDADDHFSLLLRNATFFTKTAIDGDYRSSYVRLDENRAYTVSSMVRMQEIQDYGQPGEHKLPPDKGHGYIWRGCSISQIKERDGGLYVNLEIMVLSRDVPAALRWMAGPIIRRVARETLTTSLTQTRHATAEKASETSLTLRKPSGFSDSTSCRSAAIGCLR